MNPRVKEVTPLENYELLITFTNGEERVFNVKPLIRERQRFKELDNIVLFNSVKASHGTVEWIHEQDICPDWLYEDSTQYNAPKGCDTKPETIYHLGQMEQAS